LQVHKLKRLLISSPTLNELKLQRTCHLDFGTKE